jgi:hypothetical protein
MTGHNTLTAVVNYERGKSRQCPFITKVKIVLGPCLVAEGTLGGKYSQNQAITELKHNPQRFKFGEGYLAARSLGLVA